MNPVLKRILSQAGTAMEADRIPVILAVHAHEPRNGPMPHASMRDELRQACVLCALDTHKTDTAKTRRITIEVMNGRGESAQIVNAPDQFIDRLHVWTAVLYALCNDIEGITGIDAEELADLVMDTVADREGDLIEDLILGGITDELE